MIRHEIDVRHEVHTDGDVIQINPGPRGQRSSVRNIHHLEKIVGVEIVAEVTDDENVHVGFDDITLQKRNPFLSGIGENEGQSYAREGEPDAEKKVVVGCERLVPSPDDNYDHQSNPEWAVYKNNILSKRLAFVLCFELHIGT